MKIKLNVENENTATTTTHILSFFLFVILGKFYLLGAYYYWVWGFSSLSFSLWNPRGIAVLNEHTCIRLNRGFFFFFLFISRFVLGIFFYYYLFLFWFWVWVLGFFGHGCSFIFFGDFSKTHDYGGFWGARVVHCSLDCGFHWCFGWLVMET